MSSSPASNAKKMPRNPRLMRNLPIGKKMAIVVGAMIAPLLCLLFMARIERSAQGAQP